MRNRILTAIFAAGTALLLAVGCSAEKGGNPSPVAGGNSADPSNPGTHAPELAPRVKDPIDADRFVSNPCLALTTEQARSLGATKAGKPRTTGDTAETAGPGCVWHNRDAGDAFSASFITGNENGLDDAYLGNKQGQFEYFEPTTVDGYPAVFSDIADLRDTGNCVLSVGVSDELEVAFGTQGYEGKTDSCGAARDVASAALKTMKGGG